MVRKPLIILTGPTAVGKTALSLSLARNIGGEIISADSMQVYRHMDIGTAKITPEEMQGIPHHLINILEPDEDFNVVAFQKLAKEAMEGIYRRGKIPIVTGGTGFYIQALLYDIDFTENEEDSAYRQEWERIGETKGNAHLHQMLAAVDPDSALVIHENNRKRIIRALEFHQLTGTPISRHNQTERAKESPYTFCYFVLNDDRDKIYANINQRIDRMLAAGLEEEVIHLKNRGCTGDMVSMQGLGYKEILGYLNGELTKDEAVTRLKRDTRHFAKRQLTWFRREREVIWLNRQSLTAETMSAEEKTAAILTTIRQHLVDRGVIGD